MRYFVSLFIALILGILPASSTSITTTGAGAPAPSAATISFIEANSSSSNSTTYTFNGRSIGTPGNSRYIGLVIRGNSGAACGGSIDNVTVDGANLSFIVGVTSGFSREEIWFGAVATANSSGSIVITWDSSCNNTAYFSYETHFINSGTATATDNKSTNGAAMSAAVSAGGVAIGGGGANASTTFSWTGDLTDDGDEVVDSGTTSGAHAAFVSAGTASATATAGTTNQPTSVLATFR